MNQDEYPATVLLVGIIDDIALVPVAPTELRSENEPQRMR
jgi:uncharacterized membrane protein YkvA (DUF1232 family)